MNACMLARRVFSGPGRVWPQRHTRRKVPLEGAFLLFVAYTGSSGPQRHTYISSSNPRQGTARINFISRVHEITTNIIFTASMHVRRYFKMGAYKRGSWYWFST